MSRKYRVVIDTNVLLVSISDRSAFHWLFQALLQNRLDCFVTTEILAKYEEIIGLKWSDSIAKSTIRALLELPNVYLSVSHFKYDLLRDLDDNKFVDCAICCNADYIVTNDKDFDLLKSLSFPAITPLTITEFQTIFEARQ